MKSKEISFFSHKPLKIYKFDTLNQLSVAGSLKIKLLSKHIFEIF